MGLNIGEEVPDFTAKTQQGELRFHEWLGGSWAILFSHPADFTPVCTTELGEAAHLEEEFSKRGVKLIALSVDSPEDHAAWAKDISAFRGATVRYPIIADKDRSIARRFGMLTEEMMAADGMPVTVRSLYVIRPDRKVALSITYPPTVGRNFDEILRVVDALQLTCHHPVATPVNWVPGDHVVVLPSVSEADARERFPEHTVVDLPSGRPYLRLTPLHDSAAPGGSDGGK